METEFETYSMKSEEGFKTYGGWSMEAITNKYLHTLGLSLRLQARGYDSMLRLKTGG